MTQLGLQLGTNWTSFENGIPGIIEITGYTSRLQHRGSLPIP